MEFFFVNNPANYKLTDKKNLVINVPLLDRVKKIIPNNEEEEKIIYFAPKMNFQMVSYIFNQFKQTEHLKIIEDKEKIYAQYLATKDIFNKNEINNLSHSGKINIAIIFDIKTDFNTYFKDSIINNLNYFYQKLSGQYQEIQIDIFSVFISEWVDLAEQVPVTNLYLLPGRLDKLATYDAFFKFSDIINEQKLIDPEKIDLCLKKLNSPPAPLSSSFKAGKEGEEESPIYGRFPSTPFRDRSLSEVETLGVGSLSLHLSPLTFHSHEVNDLVSIVITTYNRVNYLQEAIESVLKQTYKNFELIIVDDGSTDNTRDVEAKYSHDSRVRYIFQENQGLSHSRNTGILKANGKYIMFLDDDDLYIPYAIDKLLAFIKRQPENVKMVYGDLIILGLKNNIFKREDEPLPKPDLFLQYMIGSSFTTPGQVIAETEVIREVGMSDHYFASCSDYELWTKIILKYDIAKIDIPVMYYRSHGQQVSKKAGQTRYNCDMVSLKLWYIIKAAGISIFDPEGLKNESEINKKIADDSQIIALKAINYWFANYDSGLEILKFAQEKHFSPDRQKFINNMTERIPGLIRENYKSNLRISERDKEFLMEIALWQYSNLYNNLGNRE
jgi:glycosyltransferase involved in cell wall biosynthesis